MIRNTQMIKHTPIRNTQMIKHTQTIKNTQMSKHTQMSKMMIKAQATRVMQRGVMQSQNGTNSAMSATKKA